MGESNPMDSKELITQYPCPRCGTQGTAKRGDVIHMDHVQWYESFYCPNCEYRHEADGLPQQAELRAEWMAEYGTWVVAIEDLGPKPIYVLRYIFNELKLAPREARSQLGAIALGTKTEMKFLANELTKLGAVANYFKQPIGTR